MELKLVFFHLCHTDLRLLIVPYGIETIQLADSTGSRYFLLIVPYGIETCLYVKPQSVRFVPFNRTLWN